MGGGVTHEAHALADPYTPDRGDPAYVVTHYDLDLDYKVSSNRLSGRAVLDVRVARDTRRLVVDLVGLRVSKVSVGGAPARWAHRGARLVVTPASPLTRGERTQVAITYAGTPGPVSTRWGDVGWEELTEGALVAAQPNGAPTWFPCNDHPRHKATYRLSFECDSPFDVVATGALVSTRVRGSRTRRVFVQDVPLATYLATVHVGRYVHRELGPAVVPVRVAMPAACERPVMHDLGRLPRMTFHFGELFGDYPFDDYTVVVTADDLEIPLEAHALATSTRAARGPRARPPVVRQQPDDRHVGRHLAQRGFRLLRRVALGRARRRCVRPPQRHDALGAAAATAAGPRPGRSGARPDVRRPRVQARSPDPARVAATTR